MSKVYVTEHLKIFVTQHLKMLFDGGLVSTKTLSRPLTPLPSFREWHQIARRRESLEAGAANIRQAWEGLWHELTDLPPHNHHTITTSDQGRGGPLPTPALPDLLEAAACGGGGMGRCLEGGVRPCSGRLR